MTAVQAGGWRKAERACAVPTRAAANSVPHLIWNRFGLFCLYTTRISRRLLHQSCFFFYCARPSCFLSSVFRVTESNVWIQKAIKGQVKTVWHFYYRHPRKARLAATAENTASGPVQVSRDRNVDPLRGARSARNPLQSYWACIGTVVV